MAYFRCGGGTNPTGNATSADVLATKTFSNEADGIDQVGSMSNNGAVDVDLDTSTTSYTVPAGYHNGSGTVKLTTETKTETAGTSAKTVTPTSGKVLSSVTINPTPSQTKSCTPTTSAQTISPDSGKLLSSVSVSAIQTQTKSATPTTSSQNITPDSGKYLTKVTVGAISTQTKTATPTTSSQDITPDSGKYLTKVTVSAIQTETKTSTPTKRSATAATVTPTSGKYLTSVTVDTTSVPNSNSGTYTFPAGSTGATYDMGSTNTIRKVNAANVYTQGKADGNNYDFISMSGRKGVYGLHFTNTITSIGGTAIATNSMLIENGSGSTVLNAIGIYTSRSSGTKYNCIVSDVIDFSQYNLLSFGMAYLSGSQQYYLYVAIIESTLKASPTCYKIKRYGSAVAAQYYQPITISSSNTQQPVYDISDVSVSGRVCIFAYEPGPYNNTAIWLNSIYLTKTVPDADTYSVV